MIYSKHNLGVIVMSTNKIDEKSIAKMERTIAQQKRKIDKLSKQLEEKKLKLVICLSASFSLILLLI